MNAISNPLILTLHKDQSPKSLRNPPIGSLLQELDFHQIPILTGGNLASVLNSRKVVK
jgi:hypothetical protein